MKKFSIIVSLLLAAAFSFGQVPTAALYTPNLDVYVGYIATSPDYGPGLYAYQLNGGQVDIARNLRPNLAIVASGAFVYGSAYSVKQFSGTVGPRLNLLTGRFRPYIIGQVGFAYQRSNGFYAADHHPPLAPGATDNENGLTYRVGAGADVQVSRHFYWRVIQWDTQRQPWGRHTPWYVNMGSGVGYRF